MRLLQINSLLVNLRKKVSLVRLNNQKVSEWVDNYLDTCALKGESVSILTQWCVSKDLELRWKSCGNSFQPTKGERQLFAKELPAVLEMFDRAGLKTDWWITFNRSYLDSGRVLPEIEQAYKAMIKSLAEPLASEGRVLVLDWEDDILLSRPKACQIDVPSLVSPRALALELQRHGDWARDEAGLLQSEEEIKKDVLFQIACEAEEGRLLVSSDSPVCSQFLLVPLELPERYDFFTLFVPNFKDRIVALLHPYPWRSWR